LYSGGAPVSGFAGSGLVADQAKERERGEVARHGPAMHVGPFGELFMGHEEGGSGRE
jgi:hypothetical protein